MEIQHLTHIEINRQKWDVCIQNACNSLVYAESWYLDIVSPNWEALVVGDYEYVMPLPVKKKYGISFLVQPPLTQQLGIFSSNSIDENVVESFIQKIPYWSYHLCFNEQNPCNKGRQLPNFILNLDKNYQTFFAAYSKNTQRNIKKSDSYNIVIKKGISANDFLDFYHATEKNYIIWAEKVNKLVKVALEKDKMTIYGAYNSDDQLISALCLLHSSQRLIYWLPVSNKEGKEALAMFKIVDEMIQHHANSNLILDFEGSKIENIARFYQGFGAEVKPYLEIKRHSVNDFLKHFYLRILN